MQLAVYYTHQFDDTSKSALESSLADVTEYNKYVSMPYDESYRRLSPMQLFQRLGNTWPGTRHRYVLIADERTLTEINSSSPPTVTVAAAIAPDLQNEMYLQRHRGVQGLESPENPQTIALVRDLAEQRVRQQVEESGDEWFWEADAESKGLNAVLWQVKSVRADMGGAEYICMVYSVKDITDMHRHVSFLHALFACLIILLTFMSWNSSRKLPSQAMVSSTDPNIETQSLTMYGYYV
ncbi:hypothetical protein F5884DRAFT_786406 [Xylogone sp. PMI_703]|nr:hypothetical protein F5884DRAFT_786406 [Xylogone sp. PMI_703]